MATQSDIIRQTDLLNQLVIDRATMEEIGRVEILWMYTPAHKVLGFICKSGLLGAKKFAFDLGKIHTFAGSSILVNSGAQETDGDKVSQLESLMGCEVWTDAGVKIGRINDCLFNLKTGVITDYLFAPGGLAVLTEGIYCLPPSRILRVGRRRVLIAASSVKSLVAYQEGLRHRLIKVGEGLKEEYSGATQQVRSRGLSFRESFTQKAQALAEQAKEQAEILAQQTKERSQTLVEQLREQAQTIGEQVKEQTQVLRDQLNEEFVPNKPQVETPDADLVDDWDIESPVGRDSLTGMPVVPDLLHEAPQLNRSQLESAAPDLVSEWDIESPVPSQTSTEELAPTQSEAGNLEVDNPEVDNQISDLDMELEDEWDIETPPEVPTTPQFVATIPDAIAQPDALTDQPPASTTMQPEPSETES